MDGFEKINNDAEQTAGAIYSSLGDTMPSILSLIRWTEENFGIRITVSFKNSDEFTVSGLEYFDPGIGEYRIFVNGRDYEYRQRFTLCHEIAHIIRNSEKAFGFSEGEIYSASGEERFCDHFSAAFLMPEEIFIERWNAIREDIDFKKARIASIFRVSGQAVYYRAKELGLI